MLFAYEAYPAASRGASATADGGTLRSQRSYSARRKEYCFADVSFCGRPQGSTAKEGEV